MFEISKKLWSHIVKACPLFLLVDLPSKDTEQYLIQAREKKLISNDFIRAYARWQI